MPVTKGESLAEFVRRIRKEKRLSQNDVADRGGISNAYVFKIENEQILKPGITTLRALAKGLGVSEDEIFAVARGVPGKDSPEYKESQFASMAFKYKNMPKSSKRRATIEELIKLLDRELDAAQSD